METSGNLSPATKQLEPLKVSALKQTAKCIECGADFGQWSGWLGDKHVTGADRCQVCETAAEAKRQKVIDERVAIETREEQREVWMDNYGVPSMFQSRTFKTFERTLQTKAFDAIKKYAEDGLYEWASDDTPAQSIVLLSPNLFGVGKTHLVCAALNYIVETVDTVSVRRDGTVIRKMCPCLFTSENQLLARIRATYNRNTAHDNNEHYEETEEDVYRKLSNKTLLVIDDVGKVRPKDLTFLQTVYFRILDERYVTQSAVILTTNLDGAQLEEHIGGACADRLREMCGKNFIKMSGKSYRHAVR